MKWAVEIWNASRTEHKAAVLQTDDIYSAVRSIKNEFFPETNKCSVEIWAIKSAAPLCLKDTDFRSFIERWKV
nr:MAG TPA: hypothetical protein [Caudoviricetes sp.]